MNKRKLISATVAAIVFVLIANAVAQTDAWQESGDGTAEDMDALVGALFTDHVIALEVLGILLTAAMIGSLSIARPIGGPTDGQDFVQAENPASPGAAGSGVAAVAAAAHSEQESPSDSPEGESEEEE